MSKRKGVQLGRTSYYGWMIHEPEHLAKVLRRAVDEFRMHVLYMPDAIAYIGSSGSAIAFLLAERYALPIIYVRKKGEKSHGRKVEVNTGRPIADYMIVDDFVRTGETVRSIKTRVERHARSEMGHAKGPKCLGVYCWTGIEKDSYLNAQFIGRGRYREQVKLYGPINS